jgi:hypothetical protein
VILAAPDADDAELISFNPAAEPTPLPGVMAKAVL